MNTFAEKKEKRTQVDFNNPFPPFPREVFFDITNACIHSCFFCSNPRTKKNFYLKKELVFRLMREAYENGTTDIALYATGEPFMHKDLAEMVREAKRIGIKYVFITTNGSMADQERAKPVLDAGLDSVKFSINAGTRESYKEVHGKDHFERVLSNVQWFYEYRKQVGLKYGLYASMVPSHKTKDESQILKEKIMPYVDEFDLRGCSNQGGNMYDNNETEYIEKDNLLGSLGSHQFCGRCPDVFHRITVTPEGYASACVVDYMNYLVVADLNNTTIKDAWSNELFVGLRKKHISGDLVGTICFNCLNNVNKLKVPLTPEFARD